MKEQLTEEQKKFLTAEGKVVVKACPGSGKTYSVAHKLLSYIDNWKDYHSGVAVLSFTNVASNEIQEKAQTIHGSLGELGYPHFIGTVDSFIDEFIVLRYGHLDTVSNVRPRITITDTWKMPYGFWRKECHSKGCIDNIEQFYYGIDKKFYKGNEPVKCEKRNARSLPCQQYKKMLQDRGIIFQNETALFAYQLLKKYPMVASAIAERFPVIIIDEAQDTSVNQMAVFDLLSKSGVKSMFLVGDADQSIYEWRNASPECFLQKVEDTSWQTIELTGNFRSSQNICNVTSYFSASLRGTMAIRSVEYLQSLVRELAKLPNETEWVEFKCNNKQPQMIGEYISALSNSAALCERPKAYLVWGVDDATHKIVGTEFQYRKMKKGNEELEAWLSRMLSPRINFRFFEVPMDEGMVVLMEIPCAEKQPVQFAGGEFIRIGTNKKNLKEYPDKERELWRTFDSTPYELRIAMGNLDEDEMVLLLDYSKYYDKLEMPIPRNRDKVLEDLQHEKFIKRNDAGTWDITNMGALMIAKDLKKFESLHRRTVRVIWYKENSRLDAIREKEFCAGYAFSHEEIVQYIMTIIPQEEVIVEATRKSVVSFPEIAIRELLANAMIHQDLQQRGTNPMVEVFKNRIEFSNAGAPLVAIERIVDSVPVSRNENIAGFMHKCGICEERGSGYDKIVEATGKNELLAPRIENQNNQFTKAILFAKVPFELTTKEDRMRTCYMQACLAYVNFEGISNSDIRKIFGLGEKEKAKASRLLTSAVDGGYIKVMDPDTAPRYKKYIPYWA